MSSIESGDEVNYVLHADMPEPGEMFQEFVVLLP